MNGNEKTTIERTGKDEEVSRFAESYASFNRVINALQRKYLVLQEEFSSQNELLAQANNKLVELHERNLAATGFLNSILDSTSAGIIAIDQSGKVTQFNPAASIVFGISREDCLGIPYNEVLPIGEPSEANALCTIETGREVTSVERKIDLRDGSHRYLSVSTAILRDHEKKTGGAVEVFQDLTKIKKLEQELARVNTLAALGEMAATIAHEVRNPLNGIAGFASLLERDLEDEDPRQETVRKIIQGVGTLNNTIGTLLDYARFKEINETDVNISEFIEDIVKQFKEDHPDRVSGVEITINNHEQDPLLPVNLMLDKVLVRQAYLNLLNNAIEALKGQGQILIKIRKLPREMAISCCPDNIILDSDETIVETIVEDSGQGIKPEVADQVFAPFYSTRPGGNGLGLAVVWKTVKAHGGEVTVGKGELGGAAFRLLFPVRMDIRSTEHRK